MDITKAQRIELNTLSKFVFGTASKWQKLVDKGYDEVITEEVEETVPAEKEGDEPTVRKVKVPVLSPTGGTQLLRKYYTIDSILEFMREQKVQIEAIYEERRKLILQLQEEAKAREAKEKEEALAKQVQATTAGSAKV
jgi:hypothetical protein